MGHLLHGDTTQASRLTTEAYVQLCQDTPTLQASETTRRLCIALMSSKDMRRLDLCISGVTDDKVLEILDSKVCLNLRTLLVTELIRCRESLNTLNRYQIGELAEVLHLGLVNERGLKGQGSVFLDTKVLETLTGSLTGYLDGSQCCTDDYQDLPELGPEAQHTNVGRFIMNLAVCSVTGHFEELPGTVTRQSLAKLLHITTLIRDTIDLLNGENTQFLSYGEVDTYLKSASRRMPLGYSFDRSVLLALPLGATEDQVSPYLVHKTPDTYSAQVYADLLYARF